MEGKSSKVLRGKSHNETHCCGFRSTMTKVNKTYHHCAILVEKTAPGAIFNPFSDTMKPLKFLTLGLHSG